MQDQIPLRRRVALGVAVVAGAAGLLAAVPASAGETQASPEPVYFDGNPDCVEVQPEGADWTGFKVEGDFDGDHADDSRSVTISVTDGPDGPTFDWTSNFGVDAVIVKGGPNANVYYYDPESQGDHGLSAPVNEENDTFYGLSHIEFCYDADDVPPPTTTTTTVPGETTTTTVPGETTTTTVPSVAPAPAPKAQPVVATPTFTG